MLSYNDEQAEYEHVNVQHYLAEPVHDADDVQLTIFRTSSRSLARKWGILKSFIVALN